MKENINSIHFIRHSKSNYETYKKVLFKNPTDSIDPNKQITPDLTEEGIRLAEQEAEKFFSSFNNKSDLLFFVSSEEARALTTAKIYKEIAHKMGFEILKPEKTQSKIANQIGEGDIRKIDHLSLRIKNNLAGYVFNPKKYIGEINWDKANPEDKEKWEKAREIIDADDKGSWADNYYYYSEKIKKIFPEIKSAEEEYETTFKNLIKLAKFGFNKISEKKIDKKVKVLGFGHENYLMHALHKKFEKKGIDNCEAINITIEEDKIIGEFRGKHVQL